MKKLLAVTLVMASIASAQKTFWVNKGCTSSCDGSTSTKGFPNLINARDAVRTYLAGTTLTGDVTVNIKAGTYYFTAPLTFDTRDGVKSGDNNWVIYQPASGETVVFSGGVQLSSGGWVQNGNIWEKSVSNPQYFRHLWVNGKRAMRARTEGTYTSPLTEWFQMTSMKIQPTDTGSYQTGNGVYVPKSPFPLNKYANSDNNDIEVVWNAEWRNYRHLFDSQGGLRFDSQKDQNYFMLSQPYFGYAMSKRPNLLGYRRPDALRVNYPFYVENTREDLDRPGEWYFRNSTNKLYYYPLAGQNPNNASTLFQVSNIPTLLQIAGTNDSDPIRNLRFSGIAFKNAGWLGPNRPATGEPGFANGQVWGGFATIQAEKTVVTLEEQELTGGSLLPAAVTAQYANGLQFINDRFENIGNSAMSLIRGVSNAKISGGYFRDISAAAMTVGHWEHTTTLDADVCNTVEISNNLVMEIGVEYSGSCGITVYNAQNLKILNNTLFRLSYSGISSGFYWENAQTNNGMGTISGNYINDFNRGMGDGGGIYNLGNNTPIGKTGGSLWERNFIRNDRNRPTQTLATGSAPWYSYAGGSLYFDAGSSHITARFNVVQGSPKTMQLTTETVENLTIQSTFSTTVLLSNNAKNNIVLDSVQVATGGYWKGMPEAWNTVSNAGITPSFTWLLNNLTVEEKRELEYRPLFNLQEIMHPSLF